MTRRFTKRNKGGVKTTSTLLTGVKKMQALHRAAKTNKRLRNQHDFEGSLNKMATWLIAVSKCPPRHYGKVWVEEKEAIVKQCERMYLEMQAHSPRDAFMGRQENEKELMGVVDLCRYHDSNGTWQQQNGTSPITT